MFVLATIQLAVVRFEEKRGRERERERYSLTPFSQREKLNLSYLFRSTGFDLMENNKNACRSEAASRFGKICFPTERRKPTGAHRRYSNYRDTRGG